MLCTVGVRGSRRGFPWLSKSKHSVAAGVAGAHSPLTPNKFNPIPRSASDPVPGLGLGFAALRLRLKLRLQDFLAARCCCCPATLYQFPHEEPPRHSTTNGEYQGINPDGKLLLREYSPQRLGRVADLSRSRGNAVRTGSRPPRAVSPSVSGRSPVSRRPPSLLCRMSCGVRRRCFLLLLF